MTVLLLLLPAAVAVTLALAVRSVPRRLHPRTATVALTLFAAVAAVAFVSAIALVAFGFIAQYSPLAGVCRAVTSNHDRVPVWLGGPAVAVVVLIAISARRTCRHLRVPPQDETPVTQLRVMPTAEPTAYAVPGRPGHVVVSVGMLRALPADERRVLLAHERSHLDNEHHRYLRLVEVAAAAAPLVAPLKPQVRMATERWADEDAAEEVGDRHLVARAIARAALAESNFSRGRALAMTGSGVPARMEALLNEPATRSAIWITGLASGVALVTALITSTVQLHHLLAFASHVCPA